LGDRGFTSERGEKIRSRVKYSTSANSKARGKDTCGEIKVIGEEGIEESPEVGGSNQAGHYNTRFKAIATQAFVGEK